MALEYTEAVQEFKRIFVDNLVKRGFTEATTMVRVYAGSWCANHVAATRRNELNPFPRVSDDFDYDKVERAFNKVIFDGLPGLGDAEPIGAGPAVAAATFFMLMAYQEDKWDGNLKKG
jgi:hypothetical protein